MSLGLVANSARKLAKMIEYDEVELKVGVFVRSSKYSNTDWQYLGSDSTIVRKEMVNEAAKTLFDRVSYYVRALTYVEDRAYLIRVCDIYGDNCQIDAVGASVGELMDKL